MNVEFVDINSYQENKEENIFIRAFLYSTTTGILLILIVLFSVYTKKEMYYNNVLFIDNNLALMVIEHSKIDYVLENNQIIVDNKKYEYRILDLELDYTNFNYKAKISIDLDNKMINGNVLEYKVLVKAENILAYFVRIIKGG